MLIPFSGIEGWSSLGEQQHELSVYLFLPALLVAGYYLLVPVDKIGAARFTVPDFRLLFQLSLLVLGVIALSFCFNFVSIVDNNFRGRAGFEKFVSSTIVVIYGLALSHLVYFLAGQKWENLSTRPIAISVIICGVFSFFEVLSRWYGVGDGIYGAMSSVVHGGFKPLQWDMRLRSVAFEPPAFSNYAGFAWPWVLAAFVNARGFARFSYFIIWMVLNVLIVLAAARTGLVMLAGSVFVWLLLYYIYLPSQPGTNNQNLGRLITFLIVCGVLLAIGLFAFNYNTIRDNVIANHNISNISRLSSIEAAFYLFLDHPVFGAGFGQNGFYQAKYIPYWGFYSYELLPKLTFPYAPWPAVYSVYARFAGELGLAGLVMWIGLWLGLARYITQLSWSYCRSFGFLPFQSYPLIIGCINVLFSGFTTDTLRTPMIWITLGLSCRLVYELRKQLTIASQPIIESIPQRPHLVTETP